MPIDYTKELKKEYIIIRADGTTDSPDELLEYIDKFLIDCKECGTDSILLDHRKLIFERQNAGTYDLALRCTDKMSTDRPLKIALLARPERMEFARVYESIGLSRGVTIKAFDRPKMAAIWLTS